MPLLEVSTPKRSEARANLGDDLTASKIPDAMIDGFYPRASARCTAESFEDRLLKVLLIIGSTSVMVASILSLVAWN